MAPSVMSGMKLFVLCLLCMQNTMFTVLRRYSQGVLKENYSKVSQCKQIVTHTRRTSWQYQ
jgi:hypothetical protein